MQQFCSETDGENIGQYPTLTTVKVIYATKMIFSTISAKMSADSNVMPPLRNAKNISYVV